jgi:NADPH:quinone reductase-like Zn-dependent oxidoreductase
VLTSTASSRAPSSYVHRLKELIAARKVRPVIDRRYPLGEIVDALKWVNDGHARGKVVIMF